MFNRYWRTYPWFLQLILFVLMVFTFISFGTIIIYVLTPHITRAPLADVLRLTAKSSAEVVRAAVLLQSVIHLCTFAVPCLLFAYLTHPEPGNYLGFRAPGRPVQWLLVAGIMVGYLLTSLYLQSFLEQHLKLSPYLERMQQANNETSAAMLHFTSAADFLKVIIMTAIIAPVGEELLFRGILMRFAYRRSRSAVFSIVLPALLFATIHSNPYGFPFIFIAAVLLSLIYWLTGSLWCSIFAHFLYNGLQVAGAWFAGNNAAARAAVEGDKVPLYLPVIGVVVLVASFAALLKTKTPLPPTWSDDYAPGEPIAR